MSVKTSDLTPVLMFQGEDLGDISLEFNCFIIRGNDPGKAIISYFGTGKNGSFNSKKEMHMGQATPKTVLEIFKSYYGAH